MTHACLDMSSTRYAYNHRIAGKNEICSAPENRSQRFLVELHISAFVLDKDLAKDGSHCSDVHVAHCTLHIYRDSVHIKKHARLLLSHFCKLA